MGQDRANVLNVQIVEKFDRYLGLPIVSGHSKKELFQTLLDRIRKRVWGWKDKLSSQLGMEILIKQVLQAIRTYAMSCFRLPESLIKEMELLLPNFCGAALLTGKFVGPRGGSFVGASEMGD